MRLLFYAVNGLGLGHVTRLLGIARAVRRLVPGAEILFLTSSEAAHVIYSEGFAAIKVPSRTSARAGGLRRETFLRITQSAVWNAVSVFDPHALVVDTFPTGSLGELGPILGWPLRKVFVFRAQKGERAHDAAFQRALALYDLILIPHHPNEEITLPMAPTPPGIATCWTGPMTLRDASELLPRDAARAALALPREGTLGLLALGGGGDPDLSFARSLLRRALRPESPNNTAQVLADGSGVVQWIEFVGPLEPATVESEALSQIATASDDALHIRTLRGVHPACKYLHAFDGAICAVGYNTTYELQMAALPCMLWPFPRDVDDQHARAHFLKEQGRAHVFEIPNALLPSQDSTDNTSDTESQTEAAAKQLRVLATQLFEPHAHSVMREKMRAAGMSNGTHIGAAAILGLFPKPAPLL